MKIRQKMFLSTLVISSLIGVIGYLGVNNTRLVSEIFKGVEKEAIPSLTILLEMVASTREASIKAMEYSMRGNNKDRYVALQALEKIKYDFEVFRNIEMEVTQRTKLGRTIPEQATSGQTMSELSDKVSKFSQVINQYLSISEGPTLNQVIDEEKKLHQARKNLIHEIRRLSSNEEKHMSLELVTLSSEARRVAIKAIEFALRGNGKDLHKAREALTTLNSTWESFADRSRSSKSRQYTKTLVDEYISISRKYLESMAKRKSPASDVFAIEKKLHKARRDLVHYLYPLIEKEEKHFKLASEKTHASVVNATNNIIFVVILVILTTLVVGFIIAMSISIPIARLNNAALEIAKGNLDTKFEITSKDELGELATSFSHMTAELKENRDNLDGLVKSRTIELEASNKELESFSYSIAHDLRAPLRAITSFSQILKEDAELKLDNDEKESLNRIILAGKKMAHLIESILNLAKISRQELNVKKLDLSKMVKDLSENMFSNDDTKTTQWKIQENVIARGDEQLIGVVLQNLIDNAHKYSIYRDSPVIEFGESVIDDQITYFIKDNGVGFDMRFVDKIFGPFQRLHGQEFEGTGIGLATVERIIYRHGGKVWAKSEVGKGASLYFTLPS